MELIKKNSWVFFGLLAASFFAPLLINTLAMVVALIVALFLIDWKSYKSNLKKNPFALACLAFFLWTCLSLFWSNDKSTGLNDVISKLSILLISLFLGTISLDQQKNNKIIWTFILSCFATLILAFGVSAFDVITKHEIFPSILDAFTYEYPAQNVNFQAIYLSLYVSVAFFLLLRNGMLRGFSWKINGLMLFFFVSLIMLSSRMEIMVTLVVLLGILIQWGYRIGKLFRFTLIGVSIGIVAVALILSSPINRKRFKEMVNNSSNYSENQYGGTQLRFEKWRNTIECWQDFKLIGTGVGDYRKELDETYLQNNFTIAYDAHYNSHNQFLQSLLATGLIGLVLLLGMFGTALYQAIRDHNWYATIFVTVFALSCITESMVERQRGVVFFMFFATILLSRKQSDS